MQRSRATAALMRLKEMDRKYKSKIHEEKQLESSVSTVSTLNSISNEVKKSIPGSGDSLDTGLKPKLKIKMPDAYIEQVEEIPLEHKKDSSIIAVTIFNETPKESLETNSPVISEEISHDTTNVDSIELAGEGIITDSLELMKIRTSSDERLVAEVSEDQSPIISKLSYSKDDDISEDFGAQTAKSLSPLNNLHHISSSSQKEDHPDTYSNDSFDEESSSFPTYENSNESKPSGIASIQSYVQTKSSKIEQSHSKQAEVISYSQYLINRTDIKNETKIVELMSPKLIHTTSVCEVDLNKELSRYVKITENMESTEPIKPICLLKSPKVCMIQKPRQKQSSCGKSSMNSHESKTTGVQIISKHQTHVGNILTKQKNTKQESGSNRCSPKTQSSKSSKIPSSSKKSGIQKFGELDIAVVLKKKKEPARSAKSSLENETIVQQEDDTSLPSSYRLRQEVIDQCTAQEFNQNVKCNSKFPQNPKKDVIHTKHKKHKIHQDNNFNKIISPHNDAISYTIYKTVGIKPVAGTKVTGISDSQSIKVHRNQTSLRNHNAQQRHSDEVVKNRNNAKNTKSHRNSKSLKKEKFAPCRKQNVNPIETHMTSLRMKDKQNNHQLKLSQYIQQFEEERRKLMLCPLDPLYIHKTESLAFKPLDFPKIIEFTRPDMTEMYSSLKLSSAVDYHSALRIRVMEIREWLKDQFTLYRDYSSLISTINSNYIPTRLEDAKKIIQEVRKSSDMSRRNRRRK